MDTRNTLDARVRARGAVKPVTLAIIAVVVVMALAAWFLIIQPHQALVMADSGGHPSTPVTPGTTAAPPPPNVEAMGTEQLLSEAREAMILRLRKQPRAWVAQEMVRLSQVPVPGLLVGDWLLPP